MFSVKGMIYKFLFFITSFFRLTYALCGFYFLQEGFVGSFLLTFFTGGFWTILYLWDIIKYIIFTKEYRGNFLGEFNIPLVPGFIAYPVGFFLFCYINSVYGLLYPVFELNISQSSVVYFVFLFEKYIQKLIKLNSIEYFYRRYISVVIKVIALYLILIGKPGVNFSFTVGTLILYEAFLQHCVR